MTGSRMSEVVLVFVRGGSILWQEWFSSLSFFTKLVSSEKDHLSSKNEGIATSILSESGKLVKEAHKLEELEELLGSPNSKEDGKWLYQDDFGIYTFEGNSEIIDSIKVELKNPKQLHYQDTFNLLGLDISLGEEIDSEDYGPEGFTKYKVIGNDAASVLIEKFSGTGGSSLSVSTDGVFEEGNGSVWLDCDENGNVVYIEMMNSNEYEDDSLEIEEAENQNIFTGEINVYSLIDNDVRIGDDAKEISKVNSEQYKEEFDEYLFSLSNDLYGHISTNIIRSSKIAPLCQRQFSLCTTSACPKCRIEEPYGFQDAALACLWEVRNSHNCFVHRGHLETAGKNGCVERAILA